MNATCAFNLTQLSATHLAALHLEGPGALPAFQDPIRPSASAFRTPRGRAGLREMAMDSATFLVLVLIPSSCLLGIAFAVWLWQRYVPCR